MDYIRTLTPKATPFPNNLTYLIPDTERYYVLGVAGSVMLVDSNGAEITGLGGGGGAGGGGNNTWSTAQGDFTAVVTPGTKIITINGLPWTLEAEHVYNGTIRKKTSANVVSLLDLSYVSVSGDVITLGDEVDNFASGDTVSVVLFGPDKAYDNALDAQIVTTLNPEYSHYTDPEKLVDISAGATGTTYYVVPAQSYKDSFWHWRLACATGSDGITVKLYETADDAATDQGLTGWVDVTNKHLGSVELTASGATGFLESTEQIVNNTPLKYMVEVDLTGDNAGKAVSVWAIKS